MSKKINLTSLVLIFVVSFSLVLLTGAAQSQEGQVSSDSQPSYIDELIANSQLTQSQVDNMRNGGHAWGNIRIEARMAEQIAANNSDSEKTTEQKYQEALSYVLQQRAAGKGYGDIANENNIRLGSVIGNGNGTQSQQRDRIQQRDQVQERNQPRLENQDGEGTQVKEQNKNREQTQVQQQTQTQTKKKGLLGRFFGLFSKDKKEQKQETSSKTQTQQNVSNKVQTQNSSSSQKIKTQERTETVQRTQQNTRTNTSGNQGNGNSRGGGRGR